MATLAERIAARRELTLPPEPLWSTGLYNLDLALGGGFPARSIIRVEGDVSTGKTCFGLQCLAQATGSGDNAILLGVGGIPLPHVLQARGDPERLVVITAGPHLAELVTQVAAAIEPTLLVIDSSALLNDLREVITAGHTSLWHTQGLILALDNQRYDLRRHQTTPSSALGLWETARITLSPQGFLFDRHRLMGQKIRCQVKPHRLGFPGADVTLSLLYQEGFCPRLSLLRAARDTGVLQIKGGHWRLSDQTSLGQGWLEARNALQADLSLGAKIQGFIQTKVRDTGPDLI